MHLRISMGRPHRLRVPGTSCHVIQRGHNRQEIFIADSDYRLFLAMLREASAYGESEVHGYVLMSNHVHALITPKTATGIERTMHSLGTRYAGYFNARYSRRGSLFEGRYKSRVVSDERYWITCLRYIELNPVRAGIVSTPGDYRWSSYRTNALGIPDDLLEPHQRYLELGPDVAARRDTWRTICAEGLTADELDRIRFAVFEHRVRKQPAGPGSSS